VAWLDNCALQSLVSFPTAGIRGISFVGSAGSETSIEHEVPAPYKNIRGRSFEVSTSMREMRCFLRSCIKFPCVIQVLSQYRNP
jgi:hypothetical protein